jgi:hypothetical protein
MSAQGGTLQRRRTIELPMWSVTVLVVAALVAAIGVTVLRNEGQTTFVRSLPASTGYAGFENPAAYGTVAWDSVGGRNEALHRQYSPPLAADGTVAWGSVGGPNEALHRQYSPPLEEAAPETGPIMINGKACMQCR